MRLLRTVEGTALFIGLPLAWWAGLIPIHIIVFLLLVTLGCLAALLRDAGFDRHQLAAAGAIGPESRRIVLLFLVFGLMLTLGTVLFVPALWLSFVRHRPGLFALIVVLYPLLSVWPQEVVYRAFFFHRYGALFPGRRSMILASAAAFGFMHIVFGNPVAVGLSFLGGLLFGITYARTRSTLAAWLEHTLYGWLIYTIGLGHFFYVASPPGDRDLLGALRQLIGLQ